MEKVFLSRLTHDLHIAISARGIGAAVVASIVKDVLRMQKFVDGKIFGG
jgi:hypothetical protein